MNRREKIIKRTSIVDELTLSYESRTGVAAKDSLTGLFRHSLFRSVLSATLEAANPDNSIFSIAVLDVDRFDTLNRRDGYTEGDRFLNYAGTKILESLREDDVAGYLRDDIFGILLHDTSCVDARFVVERVKNAISKSTDMSITISAGIATFPICGTTDELLLTNAKIALNEAKMRGQDRITVCEPSQSEESTVTHTIMIVDDNAPNRKLLAAFLNEPEYKIVEASSADDALQRIHRGHIDLILSDVRMPGIDGYEFCRQIKAAESTRMIPIVLVTAHRENEQRVKGLDSGADDFLTKPINRSELLARTRALLRVREINREYTSIESVLFTLINAIEAKDSYTQGHTERVATLSAEIGRVMGLDTKSISSLRLGGILHDIGKIGIAGSVLNKKGPLSEEEWDVMKSHPELGYKICLPLARSLGIALDIIRHHHEKLDGASYPDGLSGEALPMEVRITAVVDMYDAMTTDRPYRAGMSREKAVRILREDVAAGKIDGTVLTHLEQIIHSESVHNRRSEDPVNTKAKSILIVEDDALNMKLVRTILHLEKYRVYEAEDAEKGIQIAIKEHPDLILMDIQLPGMDGISAARVLKKHEEFMKTPIVAISSFAMRTEVEKALDVGFVDYITKPIDTNAFPKAIAQHLKVSI